MKFRGVGFNLVFDAELGFLVMELSFVCGFGFVFWFGYSGFWCFCFSGICGLVFGVGELDLFLEILFSIELLSVLLVGEGIEILSIGLY